MKSNAKTGERSLLAVACAAGSIGLFALSPAVAVEVYHGIVANPTSEALQAWHENLKAFPPIEEGCFHANYPNLVWEREQCLPVPTYRSPTYGNNSTTSPNGPRGISFGNAAADSSPAGSGGAAPEYVGDGQDYAAATSGTTTSATGSFPSVIGVTSEADTSGAIINPVDFGPGGAGYTMQINTNSSPASSSFCSSLGYPSGCKTWEQFIYATDYGTTQAGFNTGVTGAQAFIQNWIFLSYTDYHSVGCPAGFVAADNTNYGCAKNSPGVSATNVPGNKLALVKLSGSASTSGNDTVTFTYGTTAKAVSQSGRTLNIGATWKQSEFNVVGNAGGSVASFNNGSSITVKLQVNDGTQNSPGCVISGSTGETNNLILFPCVANGGAAPYIQFTQSLGQLLDNPSFESKLSPWAGSSTNANGSVDCSGGCSGFTGVTEAYASTASNGFAKLNGYGAAYTDKLSQSVAIPASIANTANTSSGTQTISTLTVTTATLQYYLHITTDETTTTDANDTLTVGVYDGSGNLLKTLATYSNLDANSKYVPYAHDLSAYIGQTVVIKFVGTENTSLKTTFLLDDVTLLAVPAPSSADTPTAKFTSALSGLTATFTDASTAASGDTIGSRTWTFGDGTTSTEVSPVHAYAKAGAYTVTETIRNATNGQSSWTTQTVDSTIVNDTYSQIQYSPAFSYSSNRSTGDYDKDIHYTTTNGASATYAFTGSGIDFISEKYSDEGLIAVYIDGALVQTVNASNSTRLAQQVLYTQTWTSSGNHTIKVVKQSGTYMLVDAFRVHP
ncbi:PKD domain-containing protein [Rudaea sp. 3F27F6]|uniref:PKD domain-containing protein n=1 Tax=Rudaea sp. 3F27F6 TaxID=2502208 RepID=UPI001BB11B71|nr:PKD domain-containing protein [Rudaea sp. 3F27F6]